MSGYKLRALWLAAILVLAGGAGVIASSGTVAADTVTVGNTGADDYASIQAAVDNATPGDTIQVSSGTYGESVVVNTSDLRIVGTPTADRGAGAGAPVLDNSSGTVRNTFNAAFFLESGADDVTVEGFEFRNYDYGVLVDAANLTGGSQGTLSTVTVRSNTFDGVPWSVFAIAEGGESTLEDVAVRHNVMIGGGVYLYALNRGTVEGGVVADNVVDRSDEGDGIGLYARELDIPSLGLHSSSAGFERLSDVVVRDNHVDTGVQGGARDAVQLIVHDDSVGENVTAVNNTLSNTSSAFLLEGNGTYTDVDLLENRITHTNDAIKTRPATGGQEGPTNVTGITFAENYVGESVARGFTHPDTAEGVLHAPNNYWNASDGPSGEGYAGSGVSVSDRIEVAPYYTDAQMTALSVANLDTGVQYQTIQAAVDDASSGEAIGVRPGTYREAVSIDVANLTLRATAAERPVLNATNGPVLQVSAPTVTVSGFEVTGATGSGESGQGLDVNGDSADTDDVVLRNLTVRGNEDRGLVVDYTDGATLSNVLVRENYDVSETGDTPEDGWESNDDADGVTLWYTNRSLLSNVTAVANGDNGIYVNGNENVLRDVTAINNGDEGLDLSSERVAGGADVDGLRTLDNAAQGVEIEGNDAGQTVVIRNATIGGSPIGLRVDQHNAGTVDVGDARFQNNVVHLHSPQESLRSEGRIDFDAAALRSADQSIIYGQLQAAVDDSADGDSLVLAGGPFTESVTVDVPNVTLAGIGAEFADGKATINGSVTLAADGTRLGNVSVTRTGVVPGDTDPHGILVTANDTVVRRTTVSDVVADSTTGSGSLNGIQVFEGDDSPVSNVVLVNNTVRGLAHRDDDGSWPYGGVAGIKLQGNAEDVLLADNDVAALHSAGWAYGVVLTPTGNPTAETPANVTLTGNRIRTVNDGSVYDVLADPTGAPYPGALLGIDGGNGDGYANASQVTLRRNVLASSPVAVLNKDPDHELNATGNYWGTSIGPDRSLESPRPTVQGGVVVSPYYPTASFEALRYEDPIPLSVTANVTTATAGDRVAFTLTDALVDEPVNGTVTVADRTKTTGSDGTAVFELTATGTLDATGDRSPTEWNAFDPDTVSIAVESADSGTGDSGGSAGGGGGAAGGGGSDENADAPSEATPTETTTQEPTQTATPEPTQTESSTSDDGTTTGGTDGEATADTPGEPTPDAVEVGGFGLVPLLTIGGALSLFLGIGLLRWRGWV